MPRTTLDIDAPILRDLKKLQREEDKSLGQLVSELVAQALAQRKGGVRKAPRFRWNTAPATVAVDLADKDAVAAALEDDVGGAAKARRRR